MSSQIENRDPFEEALASDACAGRNDEIEVSYTADPRDAPMRHAPAPGLAADVAQ
jgi:hypothetical protein